MMGPHDDSRRREIETPLGPVTIGETKWNEGEDDEHWAYNQSFQFDFDKDTPNGEIVGEMLKQYAVARQLTSEGYEFHSMLEDGIIFWINYTSTSNDSKSNQD